MARLGNFKTQAVSGFAAVIAIAVGALVIVLVLDRRTTEARERLLAGYYDNELLASRIELDAERMVAGSRGYLLTGDLQTLENIEKAEAELEDAISQLGRARDVPGMAEHLGLVEWSVADYRAAFHRLIDEASAAPGQAAMARSIEAQLLPRRAELRRRLTQLVGEMDRRLAEGHASAAASASKQLRILLGIGGACTALSLLLAWMAARRLHALYVSEAYAKRRAEAAVLAREELLGVVAHDLRTPLSAMLVGATSIRRRSDDPMARKVAEAVERAAARMESLLKSLLDAASIEAGRFSVTRERCAVSPILASALDMFGGLAAQKSIRLSQWVDQPDRVVLGDAERLLQVLSNLISNALKFTPAEGEIEVRVHQASDRVTFEVRDNGPGIANEHVPCLFDRYWKGEKGSRIGSGLGLYIAKGIVDAHGGRIWVETERGRGSAFLFEIEAAPPAGPSPRTS